MISDFSLMRLFDSFVSFNLTRIYLVLLRFMRTRIASRIGNGGRLRDLTHLDIGPIGSTPEILAKEAISNIGKKANYASIPIDGAQKTAKLISELL